MNTKKQLELTRKRNFELNKIIDSLKSQMESNSKSKDQGYAHAKALITELEIIKSEWLETLHDLHAKQDEYQQLLAQLYTIRNTLHTGSLAVPWYCRIFRRNPKANQLKTKLKNETKIGGNQ